jgi:hypothetical protein
MNAADRVVILEDSIYAVKGILDGLHEGTLNVSEAAMALQAYCIRRELLLADGGQQQRAEWEWQTEERRGQEQRSSIRQIETEMPLERLKREGEDLAPQRGGFQS